MKKGVSSMMQHTAGSALNEGQTERPLPFHREVSQSSLLQMQPTIQEAEAHSCHYLQIDWLWLSSIH